MSKVKYILRYLVPLVFAGFVAGLVFLPPRLILVNSISCETQYGPCNSDINDKLSKINKKSYLESEKDVRDFLATSPSIEKYQIKFLLPNKLKLNLVVKKAMFGVKGNEGAIALVDEDGLVLSYQNQTLLPTLKVDGKPPSVGEKIDKDAHFGIGILGYMNNLFQVKEGELKDKNITFKLKDGPAVYFPLSGDEKVLIGRLILINGRLNNSNSEISNLNNKEDNSKMNKLTGLEGCGNSCIIDLRYKNPVIRI
jgi:hypothetical protein